MFDQFRDLIPAELTQLGGEYQYGRQRVGLIPHLLGRLPTPDWVIDRLGEFKAMSAGVMRFPLARTEKQAGLRVVSHLQAAPA